jgi:hypothetical protein
VEEFLLEEMELVGVELFLLGRVVFTLWIVVFAWVLSMVLLILDLDYLRLLGALKVMRLLRSKCEGKYLGWVWGVWCWGLLWWWVRY